MIDPETKAILLRVAVVTNIVFGVFGYKAVASHAFIIRFLALLSAPSKFIHIGFVIRSDKTEVHGNFPLPVLWILTVLLCSWFLAHPWSFGLVFGSPVWIMKSSMFSWHIWTSPWLIPVNIVVMITVFLFGLVFGIWLWLFTFTIVFKAVSWLAEITKPRFSKTAFDVLALLLLIISGVLTFILI